MAGKNEFKEEFKITIFNGTNYQEWADDITLAAKAKGWLEHLDQSKAAGTKNEEWMRADARLLLLIRSYCNEAMKAQIPVRRYDTAISAWTRLNELYGTRKETDI